MNGPSDIPKEPELLSEEKLDAIAREAASIDLTPRDHWDAPMRKAHSVALDAARAVLEELAFCIIEVDRSTCWDTRGVRCPWWDEHAQGAPGCSCLTCGFKDGAVLVREKKNDNSGKTVPPQPPEDDSAWTKEDQERYRRKVFIRGGVILIEPERKDDK